MSAGRKSIGIATPGSGFAAEWLAEWDQLYPYVLSRWDARRAYNCGNNIYEVRQNATELLLMGGPLDYALWIDSDNPPRVQSFRLLMAQMEASERNVDSALPSIDIIGAWYRYGGAHGHAVKVAAGRSRDLGTGAGQLTEAEVRDHEKRGMVVEDLGYIGFGMLLMRGSVLARLGKAAFVPVLKGSGSGFLTDDVSWCLRAREAGYRIYLHPGAFVEHLKPAPVPSGLELVADSEGLASETKQLEEVAS